MDVSMKLKAVKNLMDTLEFNQQDKLTLMDMLLETLSLKQSARQILLEMIEQELCPEKSKTEKQAQKTEPVVEQEVKAQPQKSEPVEEAKDLKGWLEQEIVSKRKTQETTEALNEYGAKMKFAMLYDDGVCSYWLRRDKQPLGIIINDEFAIYCRNHQCPDRTNKQAAMRYASTLLKVDGREWKVITEKHCRAICRRPLFHDICRQLRDLGCRQIVSSHYKEVLTSDGHLTAKDWEVWFVMDL